jgi:hypothetical protein
MAQEVHMRAKRRMSASVVVAIVTVACGYGDVPKRQADLWTDVLGVSNNATATYDKDVKFSNYRSFFILRPTSSTTQALDQYATVNVERALKSKGWVETPQGEGLVAVIIRTGKAQSPNEPFYNGWSAWRWRRNDFDTTTIVTPPQLCTVVVDILDAKTQQVIWHSSIAEALSDNSDATARATANAVDKMFRAFPPA